MNYTEKYIGLFLGTAVGDAIGLPREGLKPKRAVKIFGDKIQLSFVVIPFVKRFTICSDDTEHLWITAQALLETNPQDVNTFEKNRVVFKNLCHPCKLIPNMRMTQWLKILTLKSL